MVDNFIISIETTLGNDIFHRCHMYSWLLVFYLIIVFPLSFRVKKVPYICLSTQLFGPRLRYYLLVPGHLGVGTQVSSIYHNNVTLAKVVHSGKKNIK